MRTWKSVSDICYSLTNLRRRVVAYDDNGIIMAGFIDNGDDISITSYECCHIKLA